jgi:hypothetical protein
MTRRLRRIAAAYGTEPRFLLCSATIANPVELAERLTGLEGIHLIDEDCSPAPERRIAVWNPPLQDEELGTRHSALGEAAELLAALVREGSRAIRGGLWALRDFRLREARTSRAPQPQLLDVRRLHRPGRRRAREDLVSRPHHARAAHPQAGELHARELRGRHDRRPRARYRHRRADAAVVVTFPDRRVTAPDVGPRRQARGDWRCSSPARTFLGEVHRAGGARRSMAWPPR